MPPSSWSRISFSLGLVAHRPLRVVTPPALSLGALPHTLGPEPAHAWVTCVTRGADSAAEQRAQALVLVRAGRAAGEVRPSRHARLGVGAPELQLDVLVEALEATRRRSPGARSARAGSSLSLGSLIARPPPGIRPPRARAPLGASVVQRLVERARVVFRRSESTSIDLVQRHKTSRWWGVSSSYRALELAQGRRPVVRSALGCGSANAGQLGLERPAGAAQPHTGLEQRDLSW